MEGRRKEGKGGGGLIRIAWAEREQNPRNYVCSLFYLSLDMLSTMVPDVDSGLLFVVTTIVDTTTGLCVRLSDFGSDLKQL